MYQDLPAAIAWLGKAFGFVEHYHYGEPMSGAQVWLGGAVVMLKQAGGGFSVEAGFWDAVADDLC